MIRTNGVLNGRERSWRVSGDGQEGTAQGEGSRLQIQGNGPAVSLKNDNRPKWPRPLVGYANEVSAGWLALKGAACDWRLVVREGWACMTAGIQPAESRLTREREKKSDREKSERGRQAHGLHNARLGLTLMCFLFGRVFKI